FFNFLTCNSVAFNAYVPVVSVRIVLQVPYEIQSRHVGPVDECYNDRMEKTSPALSNGPGLGICRSRQNGCPELRCSPARLPRKTFSADQARPGADRARLYPDRRRPSRSDHLR